MVGRVSTQDLTNTSVLALRVTLAPTVREVSVADVQPDKI